MNFVCSVPALSSRRTSKATAGVPMDGFSSKSPKSYSNGEISRTIDLDDRSSSGVAAPLLKSFMQVSVLSFFCLFFCTLLYIILSCPWLVIYQLSECFGKKVFFHVIWRASDFFLSQLARLAADLERARWNWDPSWLMVKWAYSRTGQQLPYRHSAMFYLCRPRAFFHPSPQTDQMLEWECLTLCQLIFTLEATTGKT